MVQHPGVLLDKKTLMKAIWPNSVVEENNLNQNILLVRRALGETPGENRFIVTVPGRGYRFVAPVRQVDAHAAPLPEEGARASIVPLGPSTGSKRRAGTSLCPRSRESSA
jgi:DNA-binding winged helix-turn-helix (wHTH) protein